MYAESTTIAASLDVDADTTLRTAEPLASDERLPFVVRVVRTEEDLRKAVNIRQSAYARHMPEFAETLRAPEQTDFEPGVVVFLAISKVDGSPLGTMRIQTNTFRPLALESSLTLPERFRGRALAEATRLGVTQDQIGRMVKTALFKSYYQFCRTNEIDWMVIAGRSPIDRQYERLLFTDVVPGMGFIPLRHANHVPHRVMALEVAQVEPLWRAGRHPLYGFFFHTTHPDLETQMARKSDYRCMEAGYRAEHRPGLRA